MALWERERLLNVIHTAAHGASLHPMSSMALELCSNCGVSAVGVLRRLLDAHATTIAAVDAQGNTLLHCAAKSGSPELVALLLSCDQTMCSTRNATGHTPRDVAQNEAVRALIRMASPPEPEEEDCDMDACGTSLMEETTDALCLSNLPEELQSQVMLHLDPADLVRVREVNRNFHAIADGDEIWERRCWLSYRRASFSSCLAGTWREIFIEHTLLQGGLNKERLVQEREQRYLDRRSLAGLDPVSRRCVEQPATFDLS